MIANFKESDEYSWRTAALKSFNFFVNSPRIIMISYYHFLPYRYGRLKVLFPSLAVLIVVGFLSVFSPNFWVFLASRIVVGFFTPGTGVQMFVMASEFVGEKHRPLCGILLWAFFATALIMLGVKAYLIRQWKTLFIVCTAPYIFTIAFAK